MKYFDPHIHMTSRTTDDYIAMYKAGIRAIIEPAFWVGQPRTHAGSFDDYFQSITGWEKFRSSQFGIRHFCAICLNAKEANSQTLADEVMKLLPLYLEKENVVAVGEIGFDDITQSERFYFKAQLQIAKDMNMPAIIHTPHRDKKNGVIETIKLIKEIKIDETLVIIDHNNEETLPLVLEQTDCWAGHTIYPHTKMDANRMVKIAKKYSNERLIINSSADWGVSNPLAVRDTAQLMVESGIDEKQVQKIVWDHPIELFSRSGNFTREDLETELKFDQNILYQGNSVLRGQDPKKN